MARLNLTDEEAHELYRQWRIYHGEPVDENGDSDCPDIPPVGIRAFQWGIAYQKRLASESKKDKSTYSTLPLHTE